MPCATLLFHFLKRTATYYLLQLRRDDCDAAAAAVAAHTREDARRESEGRARGANLFFLSLSFVRFVYIVITSYILKLNSTYF